jgi:hypothetical protein
MNLAARAVPNRLQLGRFQPHGRFKIISGGW